MSVPPVAALLAAGTQVAVAGLVLALVLLGLRTYIRGITGRGGIVDELLGRVIVYVGIISILPWLIEHAIDAESAAAKSVALVDLNAILPAAVVPNDPISFTFSLAIMLILGIRLWFKDEGLPGCRATVGAGGGPGAPTSAGAPDSTADGGAVPA